MAHIYFNNKNANNYQVTSDKMRMTWHLKLNDKDKFSIKLFDL